MTLLTSDPNSALYAVPFECAVLCAMLIDAQCIGEVSVTLPDEAFTEPELQHIYKAICALNLRGECADQLTVSEEVFKQRGGSQERTEEVIGGLLAEAVSSLNAQEHCKVLMEKWHRRKINELGYKLALATTGPASIGDMLGMMDRCAETLNDIDGRSHSSTMAQAGDAGFANIVKRAEAPNRLTGIHTGYGWLNRYTGGWQPEMYIIVAAPTGKGKTTLAMMHAIRAAKDGHPVSFFSMEMSSAQLGERSISAEAGVDTMLSGKETNFNTSQWEKIHAAHESVNGLNIHIETRAALTVHELLVIAKRHHSQYKTELIVVDYLQLMSGAGENSRQLEVANISRGLKQIAKDLQIPLIAVSQYSRPEKGKEDAEPRLSHLRDSGALEQDADLVLMIHNTADTPKQDYLDKHVRQEYRPESVKTMRQIIIAKNRQGPTGTFFVNWVPEHFRFTDL